MPKFTKNDILAIAQFLKADGVLAYPSESVWGLGCDGFNTNALQKILTLKSRPMSKGLIVLTDHIDKLRPLLAPLSHKDQTKILHALQTAPQNHTQATTWLIPIGGIKLPPLLTGDFDKLAVRISPHPVLQQICQAISDQHNPYGFLVSTSCNPSGSSPATDLQTAQRYFDDSVGYVDMDGLGFTKPSQIIDPLTGEVFR